MDNLRFDRHWESPVTVKRNVHKVIEQRSLKVVYQPIMDHVNHEIIGYEALTRPFVDGTMIRPDHWFRDAYECNCSLDADLLAISRIFEDAVSLPHKAKVKPLFVNVMPSSLVDTVFIKELERLVRQGGYEPQQLILEIVEYVDYNPRLMRTALQGLRSLGFGIALDDIGVQRLSAIAELRPDFVKVDRCLIEGISESVSKQKWLTELVQEAGACNHSVIVEGIENLDDLFAVYEAGVRISQGYYWGRPMPSIEVSNLLLCIELERKSLINMIWNKKGALTDPAVVEKSREIDCLIVQYQQLRIRK